MSSNECAFPKCNVPLVDRVSGKVTGRICHIKAKSPAGPRYDASQSDEERNAFENLLLLCPLHHDIVDSDVEAYSVGRLQAMKKDHEGQATDVGELTEDLTSELIRLSELTVTGGSIVVSTGQSGGQVAHMIANYLAPEPLGRPSWSAKLREKEADVLLQAWDMFHEAYGAVWAVTSPSGRAPDVMRMSESEFAEFVNSLEIPDISKDELRQSSDRWNDYHEVLFWQNLVNARQKLGVFHNFVVKNRILIAEPIKNALADLDSVMSDALIKLEIGRGADATMLYDSSRLVASIQNKIPTLEKLIYEHLHGG
jgi:hypothetical protein